MELKGTLHCTHAFTCIVYAMVSDENMGKLDANLDTKCLLFGYCGGTKTYRLM